MREIAPRILLCVYSIKCLLIKIRSRSRSRSRSRRMVDVAVEEWWTSQEAHDEEVASWEEE